VIENWPTLDCFSVGGITLTD